MITEVAVLAVRNGEAIAFESSFQKAQVILSKANGYVSHDLLSCIEQNEKYLLIVKWQSLEDHVIGFRNSDKYQEWKQLLHQFYEPFPTVEHYHKIF